MSSVPMLRLPGGRLAYERAIRRSSLPAPARHLALTIATWADVDSGVIPERFQPSISTLAEATGMGASTVKRHLVVLEEEGWIARERPDIDQARREHARTQYALRIPATMEGHGPERAMPRPTESHAHGPERAKARPRAGHKSPGSTGKYPPSPQPPTEPTPEPEAPTGREGGRELSPDEQTAIDTLAAAIANEPRLTLGETELAALLPLVQPWLARASPEQLRTALTAGLPERISSPAAFVRDRLRRKLPRARPADPAPAAGGLPAWCEECGGGNPAARTNAKFRRTPDGEKCPTCHPDMLAAPKAA